jgi:hypothetical protein
VEGLGQVQRQRGREGACATEEKAKLRGKWHRHSCLCAVAQAGTHRLADRVASLVRDFHLDSPSTRGSELTRRSSVAETVLSRVAQVKRTGPSVLRVNKSACATKGQGAKPAVQSFLIHGGVIKTPRKPFEYSNLKISNRRQTGAEEVVASNCAGSLLRFAALILQPDDSFPPRSRLEAAHNFLN